MREHNSAHHGWKKYTCGHCEEEYESQRGLREHKEKTHGQNNTLLIGLNEVHSGAEELKKA